MSMATRILPIILEGLFRDCVSSEINWPREFPIALKDLHSRDVMVIPEEGPRGAGVENNQCQG
jgi:hypothetical protein